MGKWSCLPLCVMCAHPIICAGNTMSRADGERITSNPQRLPHATRRNGRTLAALSLAPATSNAHALQNKRPPILVFPNQTQTRKDSNATPEQRTSSVAAKSEII